MLRMNDPSGARFDAEEIHVLLPLVKHFQTIALPEWVSNSFFSVCKNQLGVKKTNAVFGLTPSILMQEVRMCVFNELSMQVGLGTHFGNQSPA